MATEVAQSMPARLKAAAAEVRERREALQLALQRRDAVIVDAIDVEGMSQMAVAELVGIAKGRIQPILLGSQSDADE